jgi:hypothetical protein
MHVEMIETSIMKVNPVVTETLVQLTTGITFFLNPPRTGQGIERSEIKTVPQGTGGCVTDYPPAPRLWF